MEEATPNLKVRIIVVDDEPISADAMSDLLEEGFRDSGLVSVRTAYNAATVLRMVEEEPCDVLVCDIQMSGMTGLELAKKLRIIQPTLRIIFLTGYDDFSYTYEAFRQNAAHYLLKTEGDDVILGAIQQTIESLLSQRRMTSRIKEAEQKYAQLLPIYRRERLMQHVLGLSDHDDHDLFSPNLYLMVGRLADLGQEKPPTHSSLVALSAVCSMMKDTLEEKMEWAEGFVLDDELVWCFSMQEEQQYADVLFQLARKARKQLDEDLSLTMFMVVADESTDIDGVHKKYAEICSMLACEIQYGATGVAIRRPHVVQAMDQNRLHKRIQLCRQTELCARDIREGQFSSLKKHITPVLQYCSSHMTEQDPVALELMAELMGMLLSYINSNELPTSVQSVSFLAGLENISWIERTIEWMVQENEERVTSAAKTIVSYVLEYINQHIGEEISMNKLTEYTSYSAGYLSRVFKQEQGISIHEYVTMCRINLARELLCNTNLRIYEIAASCGYDNTTYFIRVFKSGTGMTPQEYKNDVIQRGRRLPHE